MTPEQSIEDTGQEVAVVGMACRFPGAPDLDRFWANLAAGVESISALSDADLRAAGVDRATTRRAGYVRAAPLLDGYDRFDARFFGYSPREAAMLDPQQRIFLECAWTAVEHAGYDPSGYPGSIGVYAGAALNTYLLHSGVASRLRDDYVLALVANDKDFLTSRVSYKLDLTGPSVTVQTACSTSLVAVHLAAQSLLSGGCDLALAGGVSVRVPQRAGYRYEPDGPLSRDGHCRPFDALATGTVLGSGVGVVVLKPLATALADGDRVYAVIKGSAVNNDGSTKVDYAAPSVIGQAEVVAEALAHAGVDAATVSYVEAHGTGTALGDPVEISALSKAFRQSGGCGRCAIGSVKANVGHLDAAAGMAGLIKTILAMRHELIPPTPHFTEPNPKIDFPGTPFYVNTKLSVWPRESHPRRAGVSSLGIGGTNAHVVLEEAPPAPVSGVSRPFQLLVLSAKTPAALGAMTGNLGRHLGSAPTENLADVAHTLQVGRRSFPHRRMLVCRQLADAVAALDELPPDRVRDSYAEPKVRPVVFLLPGGGSRTPPRIADLHAGEPVFRERIESGLAELRSRTDYDFAGLLLGDHDGPRTAEFTRPSVQLPVIFLIEDALAALWRSWGVRPTALLGHSMGEITAAALAGVFTFSDALELVMARGRIAESTPPGAMLGVGLPAERVVPLLTRDLDLASVNAPGACVVSGPVAAIDAVTRRLAERGVATKRVPVDSAGHSQLFDPFLGSFADQVARCELRPPSIPFLSNLTGTWITDRQATDPAYWARQLRSTVRFADGVGELLGHPDRLFLEVGPGRALGGLVLAHPSRAGRPVIVSLPSRPRSGSNIASLLDALGTLWLAGADVDWAGFAAHERRHRVPLPTYPFDGERHWFAGGGDRARRPRALPGQVKAFGRRCLASFAAPFHRIPVPPSEHPPPTGFVAPRSRTERMVAEIWQDVLGIPRVSIHDDFFELGGESLLVTEVMARINKVYRLELSLLTLVESPTVAGLAECVEIVGGREQDSSNPADRNDL